MDAFVEFLDLLRIQGRFEGRLEFTAPWGLTFSGAAGVYLIVTRGSCFLNVGRQPGIPLVGGDFVFLQAPTSYSLRDNPKTALRPVRDVITVDEFHRTRLIRYGGGGTPASIIAGCMNFATAAGEWLREDLPPILHVPASGAHATPWFQSTVQFLAAESAHGLPGSSAITNRLAEVLLIQAIRVGTSGADGRGTWLRAASNPQIGQALRLMHADPSHAWTVTELAQKVSMSRSAFAAHFRKQVGETPLDHLTRWRMLRAASILQDQPHLKLAAIASAVGYDSEGAFGKTFRRVMGSTPGEYRKLGNDTIEEG